MELKELEELRKSALKKTLLCTLIPLAAGIIAAIVTKSFLLFIAGIIVMIIGLIYASRSSSEFSREFKKKYVLTGMQQIFDDLVYNPDEGLPRQVIADTQMMRMGNRYSSNDHMTGTYKGIRVEQADVHIQEEHTTTDSKGNTTTTYETIFKGRWMVFDFNKDFKANVQVVQKGFSNAKRGKLFARKEEKYKKVEMEDVSFNKDFKVYAQNAEDAFYILTPAMMDRIRKVCAGMEGKILFCFVDDKLHIGVHNKKDSFEHGLSKRIDESKIQEEIAGDIKLITDFVDELSLDTKLFKA